MDDEGGLGYGGLYDDTDDSDGEIFSPELQVHTKRNLWLLSRGQPLDYKEQGSMKLIPYEIYFCEI